MVMTDISDWARLLHDKITTPLPDMRLGQSQFDDVPLRNLYDDPAYGWDMPHLNWAMSPYRRDGR